jgi:hypothetical protein
MYGNADASENFWTVWLNINEEKAYKKLSTCAKIIEFAHVRTLSCDIKSELENQTKKIVQRTEVHDEEFKQIATERLYITDIAHNTKS